MAEDNQDEIEKSNDAETPKIPEPIKCCKKFRCWKKAAAVLVIGIVLFVGSFVVCHSYCKYYMEGTVHHHVLNTVSESIDGVVHKFIDGDLLKGGVGSDVKKLKEEIAYLKTEISHLQKQIESVPERRNEFVDQERDELRIRRKWKAWIALRAKMEADEPFEEELSNFYELFACDEEVIELVNDLAKGVKVVSNESDKDKIASVCKNMLKKIVRFRRIDKRKLAEISGYVLSSHGCAKGEE